MNRFVTIASVLVCVVIPHVVTSGTVVEFQLFGYVQGVEDGRGALYLDQEQARFETEGKNHHDILIFRGGDKPVLWNIQKKQWTYSEINEDNLKKIKRTIEGRVEMAEERLRQLPRDEREAAQDKFGSLISMLKDLTKDNYEQKVAYEKVESGVVVNEWTCDVYEQHYDDEFDDAEFWIANWSDAGISREDVAVLDDVVEVFEGFGQEFTQLAVLWIEKSGGVIEGFPMRIVIYHDGSKLMRMDVTEIRHEELTSDLFELPKDLHEEPFMDFEK